MKIIFIILLNLFFSLICFAKEERPYVVFIRDNALLTKVNSEENFRVKIGFYAKVLEIDPLRRDEFWVYNKRGQKTFIVRSKDINEINDDVTLLPVDQANVVYPPQERLKAPDLKLPFDTNLSYRLESLSFHDLNNIYPSATTSKVTTSFLLSTHYQSEFPIDVGGTLNYQSSTWQQDDSQYVKLNIITMGPDLRYRVYNGKDYKFYLTPSFEYAFVYQIDTEFNNEKYSSYIWSLGILNEFQTPLGPILLGLDYRKHQLTFEKSNRDITKINASEYKLDSIGVSLGYKINWEL
jgi:hypothetical protein